LSESHQLIMLNEWGTKSDYVKSADDVNMLWGNIYTTRKAISIRC